MFRDQIDWNLYDINVYVAAVKVALYSYKGDRDAHISKLNGLVSSCL